MQGRPNQPPNPYATAAGAYGTNAQKHSDDPRELEARVLLKSAQIMSDLQNDWDTLSPGDIADMLKYNRTIWVMFYDNAMENAGNIYPDELRSNIANLSAFVFKRESEILANPTKEKVDILININRNIADGLLKGMRNVPQKAPETTMPPSGGTDRSA